MKVKLPGQSAAEPNVYDFGTPYTVMHKDLQQKGEEYYQRRGLLRMLERNAGVKLAPERWQLEECLPTSSLILQYPVNSNFIVLNLQLVCLPVTHGGQLCEHC